MDINTFLGLNTILVLVIFVGICVWAYSSRRKKDNEASAQLPFEDEELDRRTLRKESEKKTDE
ncbi:cbb3-type cytochrome oxidase subunit 3 [Hydrocarboniclastica marina]|uniref:Cbb3-type cytochrome c oxidase subunit 3 n=1 Tax=Hydrocarboniclastica marina TaxID=2259620 RepID=A0A4P7XG07_9ALTE|nr:cbb3-type cytochrome c oxidase subunit 3 [Hydrocarboniclastica marina]MAL98618.1 CcoQ/FixQ family Cbb3-type cytochrome c oxidase assembly chaperone [Alteromonadaceae bacterium]QCF25635.1 cbb3-type cytochrome c oxidase subunit 3 [Hydrocarboniclastica marina]|tara:strand:+ start:460 stop:648 length:189 start_codon:yes stop_codon:yes gene_type:complete